MSQDITVAVSFDYLLSHMVPESEYRVLNPYSIVFRVEFLSYGVVVRAIYHEVVVFSVLVGDYPDLGLSSVLLNIQPVAEMCVGQVVSPQLLTKADKSGQYKLDDDITAEIGLFDWETKRIALEASSEQSNTYRLKNNDLAIVLIEQDLTNGSYPMVDIIIIYSFTLNGVTYYIRMMLSTGMYTLIKGLLQSP